MWDLKKMPLASGRNIKVTKINIKVVFKKQVSNVSSATTCTGDDLSSLSIFARVSLFGFEIAHVIIEQAEPFATGMSLCGCVRPHWSRPRREGHSG